MSKDSGSPERGEKPQPLMSLKVTSEETENMKLPQALEQALAFKNERAKQIGDPVEQASNQQPSNTEDVVTSMVSMVLNEGQSVKAKSISKIKKKKKKKRNPHFYDEPAKKSSSKTPQKEDEIEIEYIQEELNLDYSDPFHRQYAKIFETFRIQNTKKEEEAEVKAEVKVETPQVDLKKVPKIDELDSDDDEIMEKVDDKPKISKKKLKLLKRMSIAELKQTVSRPDVVEMHDVTAKDPTLLVHLKATRNTVSVPRHWCFKRKYLQGKRGIEKPPFELPSFIKRTGIMEMRAALLEKEDQKTLKAKMRDKVRPKMGKIDIDYQKLHDAFFKWQTKPKMTIHGDLYYEGKEYETRMKDKKPGEVSDDLRIALGMPVGGSAHKVPPPWLIAMQRYGPPPSYPNLKIPGLNAPIPDGCSFGYHAGGWGKPPVDSMGKPIYGDVFGALNKDLDLPMPEEEVERTLWGELESDESEEESSEEEEDQEQEEDATGMMTPADTGLVTPSGITSLPAGLETPDMIELRKKRMETEMEGGDTPALYTILPERRIDGVGRSMMASTHTYDLSAASAPPSLPRPSAASNPGVEVALDPSELDLVDTDAMAARYEATIRQQQQNKDEDFSDMVAEHAAKQRKRRKQQDSSKPAKKYKDFKF